MSIKIYKGQEYKLVGTEPYTRLDGSETSLNVWRSYCPECGDSFLICVPAKSHKRFQPNRRCQECKRPGVRVKVRGAA